MQLLVRLFAVFSVIVMVSSLSIFTIPEVDTTKEGVLSRPQVAAPQPPARFRQATRASIIARQQRQQQGPAKRQVSSSLICSRPTTGSTSYAIFTDSFFYTNNELVPPFAATQADCYAYCENTAGCVAATYVFNVGEEPTACRPITSLNGMSNYAGANIVSEVKGYTCAQIKILNPESQNWNCCDSLRN